MLMRKGDKREKGTGYFDYNAQRFIPDEAFILGGRGKEQSRVSCLDNLDNGQLPRATHGTYYSRNEEM